jgi:cation transport ATPase
MTKQRLFLKSYLIYILVFLMFSTSAMYFLVAILGESIESSEAHGLQIVQAQENETEESEHNETEEEAPDEATESSEQHQQEQEALEEDVAEPGHTEGEGVEEEHDESSEDQRRTLELPLSIGAGLGYAAVGLWMILDIGNKKIPYIIAIVGSIVLLGIYFASRTVGISSLGTEPFGIFDVSVAAIQVAIIAVSMYILIGKIYTKGMTVDKYRQN